MTGQWKCSRPDMRSYDAMTGEEVTFVYPPGDGERIEIGGGRDLKAQVQKLVDAVNAALGASASQTQAGYEAKRSKPNNPSNREGV